ncbi:MAG: hypothetical protein LIR46_00605 [Bacteroidota bacterium]|nr:hypothetical protein [Bacteroidota bacterium]
MKRSKEKCYTPFNIRWRCNNDCANCICGMVKQYDGTWVHNTGKEEKKYVETNDR